MLTKIMELVKKNEIDLLIVVGLILMGLIGFSVGYLTSNSKEDNNSIVIYEPDLVSTTTENTTKDKEEEIQSIREKAFVGSINSDKYHHPDCSWAQKIAPQNKIWFSSEKEAQEAGYKRCGLFEN